MDTTTKCQAIAHNGPTINARTDGHTCKNTATTILTGHGITKALCTTHAKPFGAGWTKTPIK